MKRFIALALILSTLSVATIAAQSSFAANQDVGQALEIAPPVLNIRANPGQTVRSTINLRDVSDGPLIVRNQINDFVAAGEDGTPKILLDDSEEESPYSIKSWIQPLPEFTLQPREVNELPVTIRVPKNAAPGGYYGVIRFTAAPPGLDGTGVSLSASLGTLVLLRVNGDAKEAMTIEEFSAGKNGSTGWLFESQPIEFITRVKNDGNSHEQPVGQVVIKDMFGKDVAGVNVNLNGSNVLPGSIRKFTSMLDKSVIGDRLLLGMYTAEVTMKYGSDEQTLTESTRFFVLPYRLVAFALIILVIGFILFRIGMARHNERVIAKARSRRRRR